MNLPVKNRDAILWAVYLAAMAEFDYYYPDAGEKQRNDARVAVKQDLGL